MEIIGLAFRSATSCCLPTGRLRSLTAASVLPFPPFGRRSLRFESALANIYCFKIKKLSLLREYLFFGDNRTRLSVSNFLLPSYRPAPVADGGVPAAFSSLWSALPTLRVLNFLTLIALKIKKTLFGKRAFIYMEIIGLAFRSATSCCLPTGRLRSLTAASVPPFPPFGRRSLRFESALANIYCFKNKKTLFGKRALIYMEIIGLEPTTC